MLRKFLKPLVERAVARVLAPHRPTPPAAPRPPREAPVVTGHQHEHEHEHEHAHGHGHAHEHEHPPAEVAAPPAGVSVVASETPNPNARKFTASVPVVALGAVSVHTAADAARHPISAALFAIEGVTGVFAVKDFVTVTATPGADWDALGAQVARTIADVLESAR